MVSRTGRRFNPGQRVTAVIYGERRTGTVVRNPVGGRSLLIWVRWDERPTTSWYHAESLTLVDA